MIVRNGVLESESMSGQIGEEERSHEEFKVKEEISKIRKIEISQEAYDTRRKEDIKKKGMLESEMIKDTKLNLKTKRVKLKQQGDQKFIKGLTNNGTGTASPMSRWTARGRTTVGTAPPATRLNRGRQSIHNYLWLNQNSEIGLGSTGEARGGTTRGSTACPSPPKEEGYPLTPPGLWGIILAGLWGIIPPLTRAWVVGV